MYNLAHRHNDDLIDRLAAEGIAYVPLFPLGGFTPLQSSALSAVAGRLGTTPMSVALAWLLQRSRTSCSSPARRTGRIYGRTSQVQDCPCPPTTWQSWATSAAE